MFQIKLTAFSRWIFYGVHKSCLDDRTPEIEVTFVLSFSMELIYFRVHSLVADEFSDLGNYVGVPRSFKVTQGVDTLIYSVPK